MKTIKDYYNRIISLENLLEAWQEFVIDKRSRKDVQQFQRDLMANIIKLHRDLASGKYYHSAYSPFKISDPKPRNIHKAKIRDRLLHKAIYRMLYPIWDKTFIFDSYSCRNNKGTHRAFIKLADVSRKISKNYTRPCFALKLDIRKFFDSVDHKVLIDLLSERIEDKELLKLLHKIISSFEHSPGKGMPLGNLTSQLFANVYLDPLDQFAKHCLKAKYYLRYADDFVFLSNNPDELLGYLVEVNQFLKTELKLKMHPDKISFRKLNWGIDYVGYIALSHYRLPRAKTVKRIDKKISQSLKAGDLDYIAKAMPSYLGYLGHADAHKLSDNLLRKVMKWHSLDTIN
ncbi:MAG: reverse transcriptase/maturase family protein [Patescibacteria group bacterium]|jgi:retron-type reverse transcriptase